MLEVYSHSIYKKVIILKSFLFDFVYFFNFSFTVHSPVPSHHVCVFRSKYHDAYIEAIVDVLSYHVNLEDQCRSLGLVGNFFTC